jgi:hypothetical protein
MPFSSMTLRLRYDLAAGRCECRQPGHHHAGRCNRPLEWWAEGRLAPGGWIAVALAPLEEGGEDDPANAQAVCWECYEQDAEAAGEAQVA